MTKFKVAGMSCAHCEATVRQALAAVPGVSRVVAVSAGKGEVEVEGNAKLLDLEKAVREAGFEVGEAA